VQVCAIVTLMTPQGLGVAMAVYVSPGAAAGRVHVCAWTTVYHIIIIIIIIIMESMRCMILYTFKLFSCVINASFPPCSRWFNCEHVRFATVPASMHVYVSACACVYFFVG